MPGYRLEPQSPIGAVITGLDLKSKLSKSLAKKLIKDTHKYKILIIKNQGVLSGEEQIEVTRHFGEIEMAGFDLHPKAPDRLVLRVSNDVEEGYRDFGTRGFHIDGSFMPNPNAFSLYHIITTPRQGDTWFVSLNDVYSRLTLGQQQMWERLSMVKKFDCIRGFRDRPGIVIHPLVYYHPVTGKKTLCIAQGKTTGFMWDFRSPNEKPATKEEIMQMFKEIDDNIYADNHAHIYKHQWEAGDFIISDNLAVGHMAGSTTQLPPNEVGLRVMHRTIVQGKTYPSKEKRHKLKTVCACF